MKLKAIWAVAFTAVITFASCSKEESNVNSKAGELTRVQISMLQQGIDTRGNGTSQPTQNVAFTSGYVYFVGSDSKITNVFRLVTGTPTPSTNEVQIGTSMSFDDVDGNSQHIYILGNIPAQTAAKGDLISTVINQAVEVKTQTNSTTASTLANYYLYGKTGTPIDHSGTTSTASVTVKPIGSRIEIVQLKAVEKDATNYPQQITGYRIDAIFMNNIYTKSTFAGVKTGTAADFTYYGKDNGQTPAFFKVGTGIYLPANAGYLFDANETTGISTAVSNLAKPATPWVYNMLAPTDATEFPHIVIRLSNIAGVSTIPTTELRWLTITKFLKMDGSAVAYEPGKIYTINSLEFNEYDHLDVAPEMKTVSATVTVTVPQWENIPVKPW